MKRFFPKEAKRQGFKRCSGRCEHCTAALSPGNIEFDHRIPFAISGDSSSANMDVLCKTCHRAKSYAIDIPIIAKVKRMADAHINARSPSSRPMPCGRNSGFKRTMRGQIVARFNLGQMLRQMGRLR